MTISDFAPSSFYEYMGTKSTSQQPSLASMCFCGGSAVIGKFPPALKRVLANWIIAWVDRIGFWVGSGLSLNPKPLNPSILNPKP